ncbi:hypothetical protein FQR65_LT04443 [Abscondita terminalis]|nr:hypothetical protein FQR65_LT04443 [Abscondita terminalis]
MLRRNQFYYPPIHLIYIELKKCIICTNIILPNDILCNEFVNHFLRKHNHNSLISSFCLLA